MYDEKEKMINAYSLLYDVERRIEQYIVERFQDYYAENWQKYINKNGNFNTANYRDLINYFSYFPLVFSHDISTNRRLYNLYSIRNKVCHMKSINDQEYDFLVGCHKLVFELGTNKVNS